MTTSEDKSEDIVSSDRPGYRVASGVGVVEVDGVIYVAPLPQGPVLVLAGSAAVIWQEALSGPVRTVAERVTEVCGAPPTEVADSVEAFLAELVQQGLLVRI